MSNFSFWVDNADNLVDFACFARHLSHRLWFIMGRGGFRFAIAPVSAAIALARLASTFHQFIKAPTGISAIDLMFDTLAATVFITAVMLIYTTQASVSMALAFLGVALYSLCELTHFFSHVFEALFAETKEQRKEARSKALASIVAIGFSLCCCALFAKLSLVASAVVSVVAVVITLSHFLSRMIRTALKNRKSTKEQSSSVAKDKTKLSKNRSGLFSTAKPQLEGAYIEPIHSPVCRRMQ